MIKNLLLTLALLPSLAFGASNIRTEKQETLFEKGIAFTQRSESSGATLNAMASNTTYVKLASVVETINGMAAPADGAPKIVIVSNMTGAPVTFVHEEAAATAENRFDLPKGKDLKIQDRASATFIYDHGADRWVSAGGSSSGSGTGAVNEVAQASHGFSVGDVLYYDGSGYALALADDLASAEVLGVVSEIQDANNFLLTTVGYIEGLSGLIPGGTYYLSDSVAGQLTATEPTTVDHVSKPVLVAVSATTGYVIHSRGAIIMEAAPDMPMVNKGELYGFDGTDPVATPVCADDEVLIADSSTPSGWVCGESMPDVVPISNGGTGQTSKAEAFDALATKTNWLTNESFEHVTATTGWTVSGTWTNETTAENVVHGARGIKMPSGAASISQSVTAPNFLVNQSTQHTVWIKTTDPLVQVCSLRAGVAYECTYAPSDGKWANVGFTYRDPGTGTRGISISRASGTADVYVDMAYVGQFEPNVPAAINVGGTFKGGIIHPTTASCSWDRSTASISWGDFSAVSACPVPTGSNLLGEGLAPSTKKPSIRFSDLPAGTYQVIVNGWVISSSGRPCHFRVSDGTSASNAVPSVSTVPNSSSNFYLNRTSSGAAEITVQSTADGAGGASGTCSIIPDSANRDLSIMVYKVPDAAKLQGAIITDEPWYYISSKLTTRVTGSAPDAEGEYRSYLGQASAYTYTETNGAPSTSPSGTNGIHITAKGGGSGYGFADASGAPSRYDIFIGKNKTYEIEGYSSTGRTGEISVKPWYLSNASSYGLNHAYDPSTGVLTVWNQVNSGSTTNTFIGTNPSSSPTVGYFDIKVFNNPLAAGLKTATDLVHLYGANGFGSTNTMARRFTNVAERRGECITYTDSATDGAYFTINCDGQYDISYSDFTNSATAGWAMIAQGAYSSSPSGSSILAVEGGAGYSGNTFSPSVGRFFPKGTIIRAINTNIQFGGDANYTSFTISKAPSPFEMAGTNGGKPGFSYHGKAVNGPGSVNLSTSFSGEGSSAASWVLTPNTPSTFTCIQYTSSGSAYAGITCTPPRDGLVEVTAQFPHIDGSSAVDQVQLFNGTSEIANLRSYGGGLVFPFNLMGHDTVSAGVPMSWRIRGSGGSTPQIYNGIVYWSVKYID